MLPTAGAVGYYLSPFGLCTRVTSPMPQVVGRHFAECQQADGGVGPLAHLILMSLARQGDEGTPAQRHPGHTTSAESW